MDYIYNNEWHKAFSDINHRCRQAYLYEERGENEAAIASYADAIAVGEQSGDMMFHAYRHAYERIIALLRHSVDVVALEDYCRGYLRHELDEATRMRITNILQSA